MIKKYETQEKIKIYVPKELIQKLDYDAYMFEFIKKNKNEPNRNDFLNTLVTQYRYTFKAENENNKELKKEIEQYIQDHQQDIAGQRTINELFYKFISNSKKNKIKKDGTISFTPATDAIKNYVEDIKTSINVTSISDYFGQMFKSYLSRPMNEREEIIFKDSYNTLDNICKLNNHKNKPKTSVEIRLHNHKDYFHVIPYKLVEGKEGMLNYLLCQEYSEDHKRYETRSYKLNRIAFIGSPKKEETKDFDSIVADHFKRMEKYGPQYAINTDEKIIVRFSKKGLRNYHRIYFGRPTYIEEKANGEFTELTFDCSEDQAFHYFRRFDPHRAKIIAPQSLLDRIINFHKDNLKDYGYKAEQENTITCSK